MVTKDYYAEIHGFSDKINTLTPFWSYTTLLNKISSLMKNYSIREENHISSYLPDDKDAGLGRTASGLPIKHYALGNGSKHILVLGGERGNDIINSQAVYFLISYLAQKISNENLDNILASYTFDFVPVLNPEGYIITTSAIDYYIRSSTQNQSDIESADYDLIVSLFQKYGEAYSKCRDENWSPIHNSLYSYQELFSGIDEKCIPKEYKDVMNQVGMLHHKHGLPFETMCNFVSNGNGIDLLANKNNEQLFKDIDNALKAEQCLYNNDVAFRNVPISYPSSKGCPSKGKDIDGNTIFELENENLAVLNYAKDLSKKNHSIIFLVSSCINPKLINSKNYLHYKEGKMNPCGPFIDQKNMINHYISFIETFLNYLEKIIQKDITITISKNNH